MHTKVFRKSDHPTEINATRRRPLLDRHVPPMLASANDEKRLPDLLPHLSPDSPSGPTFPPPPSHSGVPIPMGRSATNALSRALSLASKKLFGAGVGSPRSPPRFATLSYGGQGTGSSSPCTCSASVGGGVGEVDPKPLPDPSKFAPHEGENEKVAAQRRNADVQAKYNAVSCVAIFMLPKGNRRAA
ncbi:hypothetical protein BGW80DRAFT_1454748 [Lactifluus volemus]|nr:hypothetical protein BGW80DRAFT_1454748 [Lactifluus volemus]